MDRMHREWILVCAHYAHDNWELTFATPAGKLIQLKSGDIKGEYPTPGFTLKEVTSLTCLFGKGVDQNVKW
jgi:hypothetical protein